MKPTILSLAAALALAWPGTVQPEAQAPAALPTPGFHHLHLNSVNPEAAIDFYTAQFPSTSKGTFAGQSALKSPNNVWVLFAKVATPPATQPRTAFWHFGWHVTDMHKSLQTYLRHGITLLPLYTEDAGGIVDAKAKGVKPAGGAGFAYMLGPDDALIEYQGNQPAERFNHVHMFQDQPFCAQLWYQAHLNVPVRANQAPRTEANCRVERGPDKTWPALDTSGMYRTPSVTTTTFGDVSLFWYMNQSDTPAAGTRGHLMDHIALNVEDLDAWVTKLRGEKVTFLQPPHTVGDHRAVMIEGPSREAIELIEIK